MPRRPGVCAEVTSAPREGWRGAGRRRATGRCAAADSAHRSGRGTLRRRAARRAAPGADRIAPGHATRAERRTRTAPIAAVVAWPRRRRGCRGSGRGGKPGCREMVSRSLSSLAIWSSSTRHPHPLLRLGVGEEVRSSRSAGTDRPSAARADPFRGLVALLRVARSASDRISRVTAEAVQTSGGPARNTSRWMRSRTARPTACRPPRRGAKDERDRPRLPAEGAGDAEPGEAGMHPDEEEAREGGLRHRRWLALEEQRDGGAADGGRRCPVTPAPKPALTRVVGVTGIRAARTATPDRDEGRGPGRSRSAPR